jgi:nitric oxide reductase large subunit
MGSYKKLWFTLIGVLIVTFSLLGYYGSEVYRQAPPIPAQVTTPDGKVLFTARASSTARRPGSRWAACSSVRSGATAPTRRPTGRPTGCIAS